MDRQNGYMDRALKARDPRFAHVLGKLGYNRTDMVAAEQGSAPEPADDLAALRDQYQAAVGKKPYHGWDADELRKRITDAGKAEG
ncbi:MAG: hypothetical protein Q8761_02495 [Sweet potato little leaf phytoplasma]|nr:hypothetical protein [Sweet potato little leaf phytoplasma]